jgi:hypothetical protein
LQKLKNTEYIDKYIKSQRIKWWGHLKRLEDTKPVQITNWNAIGVRTKDSQRTD